MTRALWFLMFLYPVVSLSQVDERASTVGPGPDDTDMITFFNGILPEYPGGAVKMYRFFDKNFNRPRGIDVRGRIYVEFIVEEDGSIGKTTIKRGLDPILDEEALRVVRAMPKWKPAMEGGKALRSSMVLPIIVQ